ncbi:MAG: hypothetical protein ACXVHI_01195 [Frankiaceae bacterium]
MTALRNAYRSVPPNSRYIQPLLISRVSPLVVLVWLAYYLWWGDPLPGGLPVHVPGSAVLVWLGYRQNRQGVLITGTTVEVRGYFWDRRLPRSAVVDVTDLPTVVWRDERGRERRTPVLSLMRNPRALPSIEAGNQSRAGQLQRLLRPGNQGRGHRRR